MLQAELLNKQLIDAIKERNEEVKSLLDKGANPDAERSLDEEGSFYYLSLMGFPINMCLSLGCNTDLDHSNVPALRYAINFAHTGIAKLLIDKGASINGYSYHAFRTTHLDHAAQLGRTEIVQLLLSRGADVNVQSISGYTALHSAVRSFHYLGDGTETVKKITNLLLDYGADINAQDNDRCTPLHVAAVYDRAGVTKLLLDRGADVSARGDNPCDRDMTALHYAAGSGHVNAKTIELLLKYNSDINTQSFKDQTPISLFLKEETLPLNPILKKADVLFTFLVYGATLNVDDRGQINKNPNLQNCLTAFEKIKAMPYLGKLIESNKDTDHINQFIYDEYEGQKLAREFHSVKKDYNSQVELSFIPELLLSFLECTISRRNDSIISNLRYFIGEIKIGRNTTLLPHLVSDQISLYLSDKDLNNLNLAYHSDITRNEYDDLKKKEYIKFKRKAYKAFEQDEKAANKLLDKLKKEANPLIKNKGSKSPRDLAKDKSIIQLSKEAEIEQIISKAIKTGVTLSIITALTVGIGCGIAGVELSILAIVGIAVAAALVVGVITGVTYSVLKPSYKLDKLDLEVTNQRVNGVC
ncbi:MAG: ankyrin repeat domain-containing protein [Wolbachia sp.]